MQLTLSKTGTYHSPGCLVDQWQLGMPFFIEQDSFVLLQWHCSYSLTVGMLVSVEANSFFYTSFIFCFSFERVVSEKKIEMLSFNFVKQLPTVGLKTNTNNNKKKTSSVNLLVFWEFIRKLVLHMNLEKYSAQWPVKKKILVLYG